MGDGRALWTGELQIKNNDGNITYVDAVEKGVGITPFAWTKNASHSNGEQYVDELVHSGLESMVVQRNKLDGTSDMIGFSIFKNGKWKSMTLRVGKQTRPAHIKYHFDDPEAEARLMDYLIRRDLGMPMDAPVNKVRFAEWERNFARNNGEQTARFYDLLGFQEAPTAGNKTSSGGAIDLNGIRFFDAYHGEFKHLYGRLALKEQVDLQKPYIELINGWLKSAKYKYLDQTFNKSMDGYFDRAFRRTLIQLRLSRLGLSTKDAAWIISSNYAVASSVSDAADALQNAVNEDIAVKIYPYEQTIKPAAFDIRKILRSTMKILSENSNTDRSEEIFVNTRDWAGLPAGKYEDLKKNYVNAVRNLVKTFDGVKPNWISNAEKITKIERPDQMREDFRLKYVERIYKLIENGAGWEAVSNLMDEASNSVADEHVLNPQATSKNSLNALVRANRGGMCKELFSVAN